MTTKTDLDKLLKERPDFGLDEFVEVVNDLLARYLPAEAADARIKAEVNPRLVRHYTSEGMLDAPLRQGREARYTVDHLLQLMALRRLLTDGLSTSAIGESITKADRNKLRSIIEEGSTIEIAPPKQTSAAALSAIERIRARSQDARQPGSMPTLTKSQHAAPASAASSAAPASSIPGYTTWDHYTLLDGVELRVRSDVKVPTSPDAQDRLLDHITRLLIQIAQRRMK